jgi:hypothetical protein
MQDSNQKQYYIKINIYAVVNVIAFGLVITTTLFLLSSLPVLPSIRAEVGDPSKIDNL